MINIWYILILLLYYTFCMGWLYGVSNNRHQNSQINIQLNFAKQMIIYANFFFKFCLGACRKNLKVKLSKIIYDSFSLNSTKFIVFRKRSWILITHWIIIKLIEHSCEVGSNNGITTSVKCHLKCAQKLNEITHKITINCMVYGNLVILKKNCMIIVQLL